MGTIEFLGTGTSTGIPLIGCQCGVCCSDNKKNSRYRASVLIKIQNKTILIDTTPEFRLQALRAKLTHVDGVLITHTHADHVAGFDDLRAFNFINGESVSVWGSTQTVEVLKHNYPYIFGEALQVGGGLPRIDLKIASGPFSISGIEVIPIQVWHGKFPVYGYRIGKMAYVTDVSFIPKESLAVLEGLDLLVLGALRYRKHSTHLNIDGAVEIVNQLKPKKTYLTHISHDLEHERVSRRLKTEQRSPIYLAYDGLIIDFEE